MSAFKEKGQRAFAFSLAQPGLLITRGTVNLDRKQANAKARDLLGKLERLADPANGGTPDEIATANRKT